MRECRPRTGEDGVFPRAAAGADPPQPRGSGHNPGRPGWQAHRSGPDFRQAGGLLTGAASGSPAARSQLAGCRSRMASFLSTIDDLGRLLSWSGVAAQNQGEINRAHAAMGAFSLMSDLSIRLPSRMRPGLWV